MRKGKITVIAVILIIITMCYACTDTERGGQGIVLAEVEIAATPTFGKAPLTVSFDAGKRLEQYSGKVSLLWDFDDGGSSTDVSPKHKFNVMGTYMVSLTGIRPDGQKDGYWTTVIVN